MSITADPVMHRIIKHINAAAGQHLRAIRKGFAEAGAPVTATVELEAQRRIPFASSRQGVRLHSDLQNGVILAAIPLAGQDVDFEKQLPVELDAVVEAVRLKRAHESDGGSRGVNFDDAVHLALQVEQSKALNTAWVGVVGLFLRKGLYLFVEGQRVYAWDESAFQNTSLLNYFVKYVTRGRVSEGTASARRIIGEAAKCSGSGCNFPEGECLGFCMGAAR